MKDFIRKKINKVDGVFALCYVGFWIFTVATKVGQYTDGPNLITLWDAIWIPFVVAVAPIFIGYSMKKSN